MGEVEFSAPTRTIFQTAAFRRHLKTTPFRMIRFVSLVKTPQITPPGQVVTASNPDRCPPRPGPSSSRSVSRRSLCRLRLEMRPCRTLGRRIKGAPLPGDGTVTCGAHPEPPPHHHEAGECPMTISIHPQCLENSVTVLRAILLR